MGGGSSTTTQKTEYDPAYMARVNANYDQAMSIADRPYQPYTGERVAGFNANQTAGMNAFLAAAGDTTASNAISRAQDAVGSLLNYQAPVIGAPGSLTARTVATRSITPTVLQAPTVSPAPTVNSVGVNAGLLRDTDLAPYLNPYTDDVVNGALGDLSHARQIQGVSDNASATAAHAFGGTRQAVLDANTTDAYLRNAASMATGLRQSAFLNAQQTALQDIQSQLNAGEFNSSQAYDAQKFNAANAYDLSKVNAGYRFGTDQYNANAAMTADQYNANAATAMDQYNANAATMADQYNLDNLLEVARANATNNLAGAGQRMNAGTTLANISNQQLQDALTRAGVIHDVGAEQQNLQQAQNDAAYEEFMRQLNYPLEQQNIRNTALGAYPVQSTTTNTSKSNPGLGGILQTAAAVGSTAAMF